VLTLLITASMALAAAETSGTIGGSHGEPIPMAYIAAFNRDWSLRADTRSGEGGAFTISAEPADAFLLVQPERAAGPAGMMVYKSQPRVYALTAADAVLDLRVPPAVTHVIAAYNDKGRLMQWKDWEAQGAYGARFLYTTDAKLRTVPSTVYPIFGRYAGSESDGRGAGLPGVIVDLAQPAEIHALFWKTRGYGVLQLSASIPAQKAMGDALFVNWNHALVQHAVDTIRSKHLEAKDDLSWFAPFLNELELLEAKYAAPVGELATPEEAAQADALLVQALELADRIAVERAVQRSVTARYGAVPTGQAEGLSLKRPAFEFGIYQGSPYRASEGNPYAAEPAYSIARDAGFTLATVLPAWGWAGPYVELPGALDQTFGTAALREMGYRVKAHGVCWLQDFMDILPPEKRGLPADQLIQSALNYQLALLDLWKDQIDLWEAINEPATTNAVGLPRDKVHALMAAAAKNIRARGKTTLVNSPHEFNYGTKHDLWLPNGTPLAPYPDTFAAFLDEADLGGIDVIGLQVYPGFHLRGGEPGKPFEGPAWTPAFFERILDTYAEFRKVIHITEFSLPSTYGKDWKAGFWRQPWDEATQADYAVDCFSIAFGHPSVQSIGWWDITDEKPSVEAGGLLNADRTPKAAFDRLAELIAITRTPRTAAAPDETLLPAGIYVPKGQEKAENAPETVVLPGGRISP
jgi:hypothetical protein